MSYGPLDVATLNKAFERLDGRLGAPLTLVVGGGTAMMLAYQLPVRTTDVDAYPRQGSLDEVLPHIRAVAADLGLAPDWINPHFETFAYVLPADYASRLKPVYQGRNLLVTALGLEDLLIMKCTAGREKDVGHARALLKRRPDLSLVEGRLQELADKRVPGAADALDFLDDVLEGEG